MSPASPPISPPISTPTATSTSTVTSAWSVLAVGDRTYRYLDLRKALPASALARLPRAVKILCENVLRRSPEAAPALIAWINDRAHRCELPFFPSRVLMHDTTCSPALADLAAMRAAVAERGGDPRRINPAIQSDLVIDHSVAVDEYGHPGALERNLERDFARNAERYRFIRWAQNSLDNFRVVPPGSGILHQVNLEHLARVVRVEAAAPQPVVCPDTMLGTDSHTPMINALGVLGWGVGGIEGQAAMLGEPVSLPPPVVVGVRLTGRLAPGVTATDLVLTLTARLRAHGVVDTFVEFCGPGVATLTVGDRATVANMAPEYGSTCSYFPIDEQTLAYLRLTGRDDDHVALVRAYAEAQTLWAGADADEPQFDEVVECDLGAVEATLSGPRQPHQRQPLARVWASFREAFPERAAAGAYDDGLIALAAITSCTNTSNPALLIGAGLLARNARRRGLVRKPWVKTSLSPGSRAAAEYLREAGLMDDLEALGFHVVGYGCMTCIGNSGALEPDVITAVERDGLRAVGVISGNRNFDGRVNPHLAGAYLASPALVVAAALAGTVRLDFSRDPLATDSDGRGVTLADLWPDDAEIAAVLARAVRTAQFTAAYADVWQGPPQWQALQASDASLFPWDEASDYIRRPPYAQPERADAYALDGLAPLLSLGDDVTTDHISPAGPIPGASVAGRHLQSRGVAPADFNVYASRRTNHEVMMRGAFSNPRLVNELAPRDETAGCRAWNRTHDALLPPYEAALTYGEDRRLVVLAGRNYGAGSSRDWAAKAPRLLGVRAIIAESYERIHRSNLIGMGIVPLEFAAGVSRADLCRDGTEALDIAVPQAAVGRNRATVTVRRADGTCAEFALVCRIDSPRELDYLAHRGILSCIVHKALERPLSRA